MAVARQLHEWAARKNLILFPAVYDYPEIAQTLTSATRSVLPDGGFICIAPLVFSAEFTVGIERVLIDQIQSGGRKLVDGTLRLAAYDELRETDGVFRHYLQAPIVVLPGDQLSFTVSCEVSGETFQGGQPYRTAAVGYRLLDAKTGASLNESTARKVLLELIDELGELRILGLAGTGAAIDASASPATPMSVEALQCKGLARQGTTSARLSLGHLEVIPQGFTTQQALTAWRLGGPTSLMLQRGTPVRMRVVASASVRAHIAISGRRLGV